MKKLFLKKYNFVIPVRDSNPDRVKLKNDKNELKKLPTRSR